MKWFWQKKNTGEKLQKAYAKKMQEAMQAQRSGDIQKYAELNAEADAILAQMPKEPARR